MSPLTRLATLVRVFSLCVALTFTFTAASAFADHITVGDFIRLSGSTAQTSLNTGGPFSVDIVSNGPGVDFLSFSLQRSQPLNAFARYVGGITNFADDLGGNDFLSPVTAFIYASFREGGLLNFTGDEIQAAIWILESEWLTNIGNSAGLIAIAQSAVNDGWTNGSVQVLNLFNADNKPVQDLLTYTSTPEPASLLLLGTGLATAAFAGRRRNKIMSQISTLVRGAQ